MMVQVEKQSAIFKKSLFPNVNKGSKTPEVGCPGVLHQFHGVWDHLAREQQSESEKKRREVVEEKWVDPWRR